MLGLSRPCIACWLLACAGTNVRGEQHAVRFHMDDLASSYKAQIVNDELMKWLNMRYDSH